MSKAAALTIHEEEHKAQAENYLAETRRLLRQLAAERQRAQRRRRGGGPSLVSQVKGILHGN